MPYDVHIVRSQRWLDGAKEPISKPELDALVSADRELQWSQTDYVNVRDQAGGTDRHFAIMWNGRPRFWWDGGELTCPNPEPAEIIKMIKMAKVLRANVFGDDDETYELRIGIFGGEKLGTVPPSDHP